MTASEPGASPKSVRYFYRDALAAAWMCKHFRMRFVWRDGTEREIVFPSAVEPFFLHPDSLGLLEPKLGDLCYCCVASNDFTTVDSIFDYLVYPEKGKWDWASFNRIIQRGGVAFHWPEKAAA